MLKGHDNIVQRKGKEWPLRAQSRKCSAHFLGPPKQGLHISRAKAIMKTQHHESLGYHDNMIAPYIELSQFRSCGLGSELCVPVFAINTIFYEDEENAMGV